MNHHLLVTGATGHVGSGVVNRLLDLGFRPRVLVRDPLRVPGTWHGRVDVVLGDLSDPSSLAAALSGVTRLALVSADGPDKVAQEAAVVDASCAARVERLVKVSALNAETDSSLPAFDWHGQIEAHLAASGVPHVLLRPAFFMENLLMVAGGVAAGTLAGPTAGAPVAMVAVRDVADSTAAALLADTVRPAYDLTGPAAVTFSEVAAALTAALGRPVESLDLTPEQAESRFAGADRPEWLVRHLSGVFDLIRAGRFAHVADGVPALTGRPAVAVHEWARENATAFGGVPAEVPAG